MKTFLCHFTSLKARIAVLCAALVLALGGSASAVTYTVTTATDHPVIGNTVAAGTGVITGGAGNGLVTLRSAVIAANLSGAGPHTINVPAGLGTYNLSVNNPNTPGTTATVTNPDLQVGSNGSTVTIIGTGGTPKIVQTNQTNTFYATTGNDVITTGFTAGLTPAIVNLTLNNLEITGGQLTGIFTGADDGTTRSSTTITNCNIHDNSNADAFAGQGGAIFNQTGNLSVTGTIFANNSASNTTTGQGGAIFYNLPNASGQGSQGDLSITGCTFTSNTAAVGAGFPAGGAIFVNVVSSGTAISITGNNFVSNVATSGGGGAIALVNTTRATNINFNRFIGNTSVNGSVLNNASASTVSANDNWWSRNTGPAANEITGSAVTQANWLQLKLSALATTLTANGSTTLTASFLSDSANNVIAPASLGALIGRAIAFSGDPFGATSGAQPTIQAAGTATATYTAGAAAGASTATAQVDNPPAATVNITINPAVSITTVTLPDWTVNKTGYSQTIGSAGGTGAKTFGVTAGAPPTGLTLSSGGLLSGTPNGAGTFNFTVTATDTVGATGMQAYTVVINFPVGVSPATLPNALINTAYSQTVTASGGTGTKTFSFTGTLPTGVTLNTNSGLLSGTATAAGTFNFTIIATDTVGATGSQAYTVVISAVTVSPTTLPNWTVNKTGYSQTLTGNNGTAPYTFGVTAGTLPTGLTLTAGGLLSGTPTVANTFNFTVTATDNGALTGSQAYTVVINPAVTVAPATLPNWTVNKTGYSQTVTAANGTGTKTLSLTAGAIPTGMTFTAATGVLNGTPTAAGTFNFTVTATDTVGATGAQAYTVVINAAIAVSPATLPNWTVNKTGYSQTVTAANGTGTKTLSLTAGAVPTGMTFTPATGVLDGTPTATGTFNFTVTATDTVGATGSQAYTVVINAAIAVSPATLPNWTVNKTGYTQTITTTGGTGASTLAVTAGAIPTGMTFTPGTGVLNGTPTAAGTFNFTVTATDNVGATGAQAYTVVINAAITVSPATLPNWTVNKTGYSQTITSANGTGARTLAISAGAIPTGLTFTPATGALSGTPTAAGSFNFTVTATDTVGATGATAYTVVINPVLAITTATLPNATVNAPGYSQAIATSGGTAPITFGITAGTIPTGMTFSSGGLLSGTPTVVNTFNFTVTATDNTGATAAQAYTVNVVNITLAPASLPNWTVNKSGYSQTLTGNNGTAPYTFGVTAGTLPTGLTLTAGGLLSGTPTVANTFNFTVTTTDNASLSGSQSYTVVINPAVTVSPATLPNWTVNKTGYSQTVTAANGTGAKTLSLTAGAIPTGMTFTAATGVLNGTPTATGTFNFTVTATDTVGATGSQAYTVVINAAIAVSPATLPNWTVNKTGYTQNITNTGGTGASTFSVSAGAIPTGMTLSAAGVLSGTPTVANTFNFTVTATDTVGATGAQAYTVVINAAVSITTATLPNWTVNKSGYSQTITNTGGTGASTFGVSAGALPTGMTLSAAGLLSGTPTVANTFNFTVTATDMVGATGAQAYTVVINATVAVSPSSLPDWTVNKSGYSQTVSSSNGTGAKTLSLTAGAIPTGMTFTAATGVLNGTPTATGTFNFTITATDSVGATGAQAYTVVINAAIAVSPATLPNWTVNKSGYSQTITNTGGTGASTFGVSAGAIPTGMTLSAAGVLSGTPTVANTFNFTVTATDTVGATGSQAYTVVINAAIAVDPATLPNWTVNQTGYSQSITRTGGTGASTFGVTAGAVPTGMTLSAAGLLSGTPTVANTFNFTVTATDTVGATGARAYTVVINAAPAVGPASLPDWTVNKSGYSQTITNTGGTGASTFGVTAGALPTGMALSAAGLLNGTPTVAGTFNFTVTATDSVGATGSQAYTVVINAAVSITTATLPDWTVNQAGYSQTIANTGGTGASTFGVSAGAIPTGMTLNAAGVLSGTPTVANTFNFTVTATDTVGATGAQAYTVVINAALAVSPATLPNWTVNQTGYSQTITNTGGTGASTFGVTAGVLPTGMTLSAAGVLSGTPTVANTFNFTVTTTDTVGATGALAYTVVINPGVTVSPATLANWTVNRPGYTQAVTAASGTGAKALSLSAGAVPTGMTFTAATGVLDGTPTATGTFNFTITATDSVGATGSQAYAVTINALPTFAPVTLPGGKPGVAYNQTASVTLGTAPYGTASISNFTPGTSGLTLGDLTLGAGTVTIAFTPSGGGAASFTVSSTDAAGATATRDYTINFNQPPVAVDDAAYVKKDAPVDIDVLANDSDPDLDALKVTAVTQGAHGTVTIINGGAKVNYAPTGKFQPDTFTYTIDDGFGATATATVTMGDLIPSEAGVYNGLVQAAPLTTPDNERTGLIRVSINRTTGKFTGSLKLAVNRFVLGGTFDASGAAKFGKTGTSGLVLKRKNLPDLQLTLQLTLASPIVELTGALTENGVAFADIAADRALYTAKKNPVAPLMNVTPTDLVARYTVHFAALNAPNNGYAATKYPQGDGVGQLTVTKAGTARLTGTLADGTAFTYANALSKTNHWPFYVALVGGKGSISGDVTFTANVPLNSDLDGIGLNWFKPANPAAKYYPDGWANGIQTDLLGSKFIRPPAGANSGLFPGLTAPDADGNANVILTDGNLPVPGITQAFNISTKNAAVAVSPNLDKVSLSLQVVVVKPGNRYVIATPVFRGGFDSPADHGRTLFKGVILQKQAMGYGFFLGINESGAVTIAPK